MEDYDSNPDKEISSLVEGVKRKLEKVDSEAKGKKKDIINEFAKSLEGKFREDTIAMVIVHELKGVVSERFIHECLHEKYKQKHRVLNAKKQKKRIDDKLAVAPPSKSVMDKEDQEENTEKDIKQPMLVNVDGSISIQNHDDGESDIDTQDLDTSNYEISIYYPQQQQPPPEENNYDKEIDESSNFKEISSSENQNPDDGQDLEQLISIDENNVMSENKNKIISSNYILDLEFSMPFDRLKRHMAPLFSKIGKSGLIWFRIKVNTKKSEIIYYDFGRKGESNDFQVGI